MAKGILSVLSEGDIELLNKQTILSLFREEIAAKILRSGHVVEFGAGKTVCIEGDPADRLIVLLEGELEYSSKQAVNSTSGTLTQGRSVNLYSVIRGFGFQYTVKSTQTSRVAEFRWAEIVKYFRTYPKIYNYLMWMTENQIVRKLAKDLDDQGFGKEFKIELLGSLNVKEILPNQYLKIQNKKDHNAYVLESGQLALHRSVEGSKISPLWHMRVGDWCGLRESFKDEAHPCNVKTIGTSRVLALSAKELEEIKESFPDELERYVSGVRNQTQDEDDDSETEVEDEIAELFKNAVEDPKKSVFYRFPWVKQNDQMDCGPACMAMISQFWGNDLNLQFWRQRLSTDQSGTTLYDLANTAEKTGFITYPAGIEDVSEIESELLPAIALRKYHYLVIYKTTDTHVIVGDPGQGISKIPYDEFHEGFENAVLFLKPTQEFFTHKKSASKYGHFLQMGMAFKKEIATIFAISVLMISFGLAPAFFLQLLFDQVLESKSITLLAVVLLAGSLSSVMNGVLGYIRAGYINHISTKFDFMAVSAFFRKFFSLPYEYISTRHVGDFTHRLYEMERMREFLTTNVLSIVLDAMSLVVFSVVLYLFNPSILLATLLMCSLLVGITLMFTQKLVAAYQETFTSRADQESLQTDFIKATSTIKTLSAEVVSRWRLEERVAKSLGHRAKFLETASKLHSLSGIIDEVAKLAVVCFAAYLAIQGNLSAGQVISVSILVRNVIDPFNGLANAWSGIQEAKATADRLNDVFLAESEKKSSSKKEGFKKKSLRGEIEFQNVWFRYGGESNNWALQDVSFKIEPGQSVAVVGQSGSGKSTIGQLLGGLYTPTKGNISIDGRDIREYDTNWLRQNMGFILQEPNLFQGTILENIALADPEPRIERVVEVAVESDAHDFIVKKPNEYHYHITHGGLGLSGGEKQRIAFARALYQNPKVLVLDEATSALDGISEKRVIDNLKASQRTIVNIAHRFHTATASDFVLVMEQGRVAAIGSHSYLAETSALYVSLFNLPAISEKNSRRKKTA